MTDSAPALTGSLESALYAADLEAALRFWRDVIGLELLQSVPGRHVFFRVSRSPAQVLLVFNPDATRRPPSPDDRLPVPPHGAEGQGHYCMAAPADQLDAWRARLEARGISIEADLRWPNGARSIYFRDPAGNSIEIADPSIWD